jgi:hypothetical protein
MTSKIQKVAVGGGKFEMRRILVPAAKVTGTSAVGGKVVPPATSSAGILAAESRLAAVATTAASLTATAVGVKSTLKRSLSAVVESKG